MPPKRKLIHSDNDEQLEYEEEEEGADPKSPPRPKRKGRPTEKQALMEEADFEAEQQRINRLQKELKKRQQQASALKKASSSKTPVQNENVESEDEEDARPQHGGFSSSIRPLMVSQVPNTQKQHRKFKRVGAAAAHKPGPDTTRVSSNAYKGLPASSSYEYDDFAGDFNSEPQAGALEDVRMQEAIEHPASMPLSTKDSSSPGWQGSEDQPQGQVNVHPLLTPRSLFPVVQTGMPRAGVTLWSSSPVPGGDTVVCPKTPAFRPGVVVNPKKPKAADYEDVVQALILRAAFEYEALVSTKNAFPDTSFRHKWALKAWKNTTKDAEELYEITDAISSLIRQRGSRIRGHALGVIRPLLISMLGFRKGSSPAAVAANQQLAQKLKPAIGGPLFHFKDIENMSGYAEAKIISTIIEAVWFEDMSSHGVIFSALFSPIPLETMALVMTILDFCIDEWVTGRFVKAKLWESGVIERHKVYRKDLEEWQELNNTAVNGIRKKIFLRASRNAGVVDISTAKQALVGEARERARKDLEGRTGETDSEAEG